MIHHGALLRMKQTYRDKDTEDRLFLQDLVHALRADPPKA